MNYFFKKLKNNIANQINFAETLQICIGRPWFLTG